MYRNPFSTISKAINPIELKQPRLRDIEVIKADTSYGNQGFAFIPADKICQVEFYSLNREIDYDHVNEIVIFQRDRCAKTGSYEFVTDFTVCQIRDTHPPQLVLIDGQHRVEAIKRLPNTASTMCPVKVISCSIEEIPDYFMQVNVGLRMTSDIYSVTAKYFIDNSLRALEHAYPQAIRKLHTCRPRYDIPALESAMKNMIDSATFRSLREAIFNTKITVNNFIETVDKLNVHVANDPISRKHTNYNTWKTAEKINFYCGTQFSANDFISEVFRDIKKHLE